MRCWAGHAVPFTDFFPPVHLYSSLIIHLCQAEWELVGDPTETALVVAAIKSGVPREYWFNTHGLRSVCEFAFDSDRKRMSVCIAPRSRLLLNVNSNCVIDHLLC